MKNYGQTSDAKDNQTKEALAGATVAYAHDITPEESDAIIDNTAFVWQTSGGEASIPAKSSAIISRICGNYNYGQNGKIVPFTATSLLSRVYNLFNPTDATLYVPDKALNNYGQVVDNDEYNLYCVPVLAGVDGGNNGYVVVYDPSVAIPFGISNMAFSETMPTAETENLTLITAGAHGNSTSYLPAYDGYLIFSYPKTLASEVCLHFAWSGYNDDVFAPYEAYSLQMPSQVQQGLFGIGSVCDEINNTGTGEYIKRIGVFNSKNAIWEEWTEEIYDPGTQTTIQQFMGYKTNFVQSTAAKSSETIITDSTYGLTDWQTDANGLLKVMAVSQDPDILAQLTTSGRNVYYKLAKAEETDIEYNGLLTVGDFGDMHFFGTTDYYALGNIAGKVAPSSVVAKYGTNYRDTIRNLAKSGVIFSPEGITTPGVYFSPSVSNVNVSGTLVLSTLTRMMMFTLAGSNNTIVLPGQDNLGTNAFSIQCKIIQDATGSRNLYFMMDDGIGGTTNIKNPSEVDFSVGSANQSCIATLLYDGNGSWWIEATSYVD